MDRFKIHRPTRRTQPNTDNIFIRNDTANNILSSLVSDGPIYNGYTLSHMVLFTTHKYFKFTTYLKPIRDNNWKLNKVIG
jgi:hypothetical protein